jgi:hypothetical protein
MATPVINGAITPAQEVIIKDDINAILAELPFLLHLTPELRKSLRKMGPKRQGYVNGIYNASVGNPSAIPATFDMVVYTGHKDLYDQLQVVNNILSPLMEGVNDTLLAIGNELMHESDLCYSNLKTASKGNSALTALLAAIKAGTAQTRVPNQTFVIPAGGSVTFTDVDVAKPVINSGTTVVAYYKATALPSTQVKIMPMGSAILPADFKNVVIVNLSASDDGEVTLRLQS